MSRETREIREGGQISQGTESAATREISKTVLNKQDSSE
jgi:hypothetical protein